ncbi:hypothetical protein OJ997_06525 [Solirubrobacter phytolaccae]|uniref:Uncharacterized protein n=1 Tax=Solirubrobacter phytolaccae TaxID=1404360 RepID=A0A9X3SE21_9ACTN|nr:hypothetical protein [Solirubrobacter phytolaccae]MDA0179942.1 hypothetical protein [Solirubrobacter phytolaccae]
MLALLTGCGAGSPSGNDLTKELQQGDWSGARVSNVSCVQKEARVFTCMGDYRATRESLEANNSTAAVDSTEWTDEDWEAIAAGQSGRVSWEVTVDESGKWIARQT